VDKYYIDFSDSLVPCDCRGECHCDLVLLEDAELYQKIAFRDGFIMGQNNYLGDVNDFMDV